jgi:hypothetical protein
MARSQTIEFEGYLEVLIDELGMNLPFGMDAIDDDNCAEESIR